MLSSTQIIQQSKKKSFDDLKIDLVNLSDTLSENQFVHDIGRRMFIKIKEIGPEFLTNLVYTISDKAKFELMIEDANKYERVVLSLEEFYRFYHLVITYSMITSFQTPKSVGDRRNLADSDENSKENNETQWNSTYPSTRHRSSTLNEAKICVICFSKPIQVVLPCLHGFCEDCCAGWYEGKQKNECLMCRTPMGDGAWYNKTFEIMSKDAIKERNHGGVGKNDIITFVNSRTKKVKLQ